VEGFGGLGRG